MAKTNSNTINCDEVKITPNGAHVVSVEIEGFSVNDLLEDLNEDEVTEYVGRKFNPEDVFPATDLEKWAESEGYIKQSNTE